ncbi:PAS domain-containing protein [Sagittula sp. NFXS13]|uniref:CheR family methyltransferase n=1 Tax=Sagittula sp. NFXS13 TaxID=2819095 RepID=UPI0032DF1F3B
MKNTFPVIGVGASAGGLEALRELFSGKSGDGMPGMAFVVIQHLDPNHESLMAQLIERYTNMTVTQACGGEDLEENHIYVIPPGHGLSVHDGTLQLTEFTDPRGLRRPIDDFFEALAIDIGPQSACVILSGTGADGTRGLRAIKEHGGLCVVQTPESASYDGMPTSAIGTGLADFVTHPSDILSVLGRFFKYGKDLPDDENSNEIFDHITDICDTISDTLGHDFSMYKRSTLSRRIARRMQVLGLESPKDYLDRVRRDSEERSALFSDLLINVTRFFRDPGEFERLETKVIQPLIDNCEPEGSIRVWVAGCSSGEEAYSIAMLLHHNIMKSGKSVRAQVFATDIDAKMLDIARGGTYPLAALPDIPEHLRNRYTVNNNSSFSVTQSIRDMVRFSLHSLIKDPPFPKMDLVSCRNLLIYFDEDLQREVVPLLHFALSEEGYLFLGSSEAIGRFEDLFQTEDQTHRLFKRKPAIGRYNLRLPKRRGTRQTTSRERHGQVPQSLPEDSFEQQALRRLAEAYAPVSMLLDPSGNLIQRYGNLSKFLDFPDRTDRQVHVPSLAKLGLREVIGGLVRDANTHQRRLISRGVEVQTGFGTLPCDVMCEPLREEGALLVVIRETGDMVPGVPDGFEEVAPDESHLRYLEQELQATRHRLNTTVEELETTNEELKSSNEEMMSMNEELQSTNEELTTVNDELKNKVDQLMMANSDLSNFFNSTELVVVVVDAEVRIRSFTEAAAELFNLKSQHVGRLFSDVSGELDDTNLISPLNKAVAKAETSEFRISSKAMQRDFVARTLPYRRQDGEYDGATLVLADVTEALRLEQSLEEERQRLRLALEVARIGIWEYEPETDVIRIDETERKLLDLGADFDDRMEPLLARLRSEDRDRVNQALRQSMNGTRDFNETFSIELADGRVRWLHGMGRRFERDNSNKFVGVTYDVTAERDLLDQRELMIREMNHRVKNLFAIISALISISSREAEDVSAFAISLRSRIRALAESHGLTNNGADVQHAMLHELVQTVLRPSLSSQTIELSGPDLEIQVDQITSLALILHEWGTNSTKYGALSLPDGKLSITVSVQAATAHIRWIETGRTDQMTERPGFGTSLVEATAHQLQGSVSGAATQNGFERTLTIPYAAT